MGGAQIGHGDTVMRRHMAQEQGRQEDPLITIQIIMSLTTVPSQRAWWDGPDTEVVLLPAILVLTPVGGPDHSYGPGLALGPVRRAHNT